VLDAHVREGQVDYQALAATSRAALEGYLASLEAVCPRDYVRWRRSERIAFWINAYNAYTLKLVADHHPVQSIREIRPREGGPFVYRFVPLGRLVAADGPPLSLDEIEKSILLRALRAPEVHFALVCAARGCPTLAAKPYTGEELEGQLRRAAEGFIRDRTKNRWDARTQTLWLSALFEWYEEDFRALGGVDAVLRRHGDAALRRSIGKGGQAAARAFLPYDWALNAR
jgi:hypothetical protein